jgi:hypothetical protein
MADTLAAALVDALPALTVIDKSRRATIEKKSGGSFSYEYADVADIVRATRPILAEHGIVALTPVHDHGTGLACTVVFLHSSGERMDFGPFPFPHGNDARATGSMVTYHRRYALVAALGMAVGDEDDDGAAAVPRSNSGPTEPPTAGPTNAPTCKACGESLAGADVVRFGGERFHKACHEGRPM